jgi:hypothetical protein
VKKTIVHNHWIDKIALLNAVLSGVTLYPQLYILLVTKISSDSISTLSFFLILSNSLIWIWYGVHRGTYPLIISSTLNAIAAGGILMLLM